MRRVAYPYGRYLLRERTKEDIGPRLESLVTELGFAVVKFDNNNEGRGSLIVAVNKKVGELFRQDKPPGRVYNLMGKLLSGFEMDMPPFRDMDVESQRIGLEFYLWPVREGTLMEMFILPFMEHLDRPEIPLITESREEEITDWFLCEQVWENIEPKIVAELDAEPVHRRA